MFSFEDIQSGDVTLEATLSSQLNKILSFTKFNFQFLTSSDDETQDANELIESIFPASECDDYKPGNLLFNDNVLCLAAIKKGMVVGCLTFTVNGKDAYLNSLAVDPDYCNKKIGSLLMICMNDICTKCGITSVDLISSPNGELLYKSFGFTKMAHQSYQAEIPFNEHILKAKLNAISMLYLPSPKIARNTQSFHHQNRANTAAKKTKKSDDTNTRLKKKKRLS